jgi:hypothetical protein
LRSASQTTPRKSMFIMDCFVVGGQTNSAPEKVRRDRSHSPQHVCHGCDVISKVVCMNAQESTDNLTSSTQLERHDVGAVNHTLPLFCLPHSHEKIVATSKHVLPSGIMFVT